MNYTHKFMNLDNYFGENLFKIEGENKKEKKWRKEDKNWASNSGMEEQNAREMKSKAMIISPLQDCSSMDFHIILLPRNIIRIVFTLAAGRLQLRPNHSRNGSQKHHLPPPPRPAP